MRRTAFSSALVLLVAAMLPASSAPHPPDAGAWGSILAERAADSTDVYHPFPESLTSAMPSTRYLAGSDAGITLSHAVVSGRFVHREPGTAEVWPEGSDAGVPVAWDGEADTRTLDLVFDIDHVLDLRAGVSVDDTTTVSIRVDGDESAGAVAAGLLRLGEGESCLVFLRPGVDGGWTVALDSALIGVVSADGSLRMPVLDEAAESDPAGELAAIVIDATTLGEITTAAAADREIDLLAE
ncbi:hypothetical protein GCM10028784_26360 [Myceligenerans cantabricum]